MRLCAMAGEWPGVRLWTLMKVNVRGACVGHVSGQLAPSAGSEARGARQGESK